MRTASTAAVVPRGTAVSPGTDVPNIDVTGYLGVRHSSKTIMDFVFRRIAAKQIDTNRHYIEAKAQSWRPRP